MHREVLADLASAAWWSEDRSTQNAARIVHPGMATQGGVALNEVPHRLPHRLARSNGSLKGTFVEHAERAAIYLAARHGYACCGAHMYALWAACPCCARAIVSAGIARVYTCEATFSATPARWRLQVRTGLAILDEAGVEVEFIRDVGQTILFDGKELTL